MSPFRKRKVLKVPVLFSMVTFLLSVTLNPLAGPKTGQDDRLFPPHLLHASWQKFPARGYARPVTGSSIVGNPALLAECRSVESTQDASILSPMACWDTRPFLITC